VSFDYYVAVHQDKWPTAAALQSNLEALGYPLALGSTLDQPLSIAEGTFSLPVIFEDRPVDLEAEIEQATDADDTASLFGLIANCAAPHFQITNGDYF
jgi:hypothetical protein